MKAYWLNCSKCDKNFDFNEVKTTESNSVNAYLWYKFLDSDNDQSLLSIKCPNCNGKLQIAYYLTKNDEKQSNSPWKVKHIVSTYSSDNYYPMLWETYLKDNPKIIKYDFKYLTGNNAFGLNHPPIMDESELKDLIDTFNSKCHKLL